MNRRRLRVTSAAGGTLAFVILVIVVALAVGFVFGKHEIGGVKKRALFGPDVDERGLDAWKDCFDPA